MTKAVCLSMWAFAPARLLLQRAEELVVGRVGVGGARGEQGGHCERALHGGAPTALDPAANTSTVLLGPPVNGGGVTDALLYPDQK
jgi:hypothetical protein